MRWIEADLSWIGSWIEGADSVSGQAFLAELQEVLPDLELSVAVEWATEICREYLESGLQAAALDADMVRTKFAPSGVELTDVQAQRVLNAVLTYVCPEFD